MTYQGIVKTFEITVEERQKAEALLELVNRLEGLELPITLGTPSASSQETNHFFYYVQGQLVGLATTQDFGELEACGLVHPNYRRKGIGRALLAEIKKLCRDEGYEHLILLCDEASASGRAFVAAVGGEYQSAEYHLELDPLAIDRSRLRLEELQFRPAGTDETDLLVHLQMTSFDDSPEEAQQSITRGLQDSTRQYFIGWLGQTPVGLLRLGRYEQFADVTAFGVLPPYRGRGYGRQMLLDAIDVMLAEKWSRIAIDVATDNFNALGLYQSCGFRTTHAYGFYSLAVTE